MKKCIRKYININTKYETPPTKCDFRYACRICTKRRNGKAVNFVQHMKTHQDNELLAAQSHQDNELLAAQRLVPSSMLGK